MSGVPTRLPRSAWLAVGVAVAATVTAGDGTAAGPVVFGLVTIAIVRWGAALVPARARVPLVAVGLGAVLLGMRSLAGPGSAPPPGLPTGGGPWAAVVESVGSPRNGEQVARLRLVADDGEVLVAATLPAFPVVRAGAVVEVSGRLRPPPADDPYGAYLRRTGASGTLDGRTLAMVRPPPGIALQSLRDGAGDALRRALPEPEAGLAAGILVGLRERVDRALAADFATAGVSHVVAISGWNIAIVAGLVGAVLRGRSRRVVAIGVLGTVVAYVAAAGASPSVVRAAVMAAIVLLARESGRAGRAPAALGAAAAVLLLVDPGLIGDAGFRLSVLATAGLLAWGSPLAARIGRLGGGRVPRWLAESLGVSLAAQAATLPDVVATFGRLSLVAPAVNIAVVPLVPLAMAGGVVALVGGWAVTLGLPAALATLAGLPDWLVLHVIVALVRLGASFPFAAVTLPDALAGPAALATAAAVLAGPAVVRRLGRARRRPGDRAAPPVGPQPPGHAGSRSIHTSRRQGRRERVVLIAAAIVVSIAVAALGDAAHRATRLTILDVGQGDAILLESRTGARMLVDGGPDPDRTLLVLDERIPPWDRRIDVLVLSHPHEDHVAGLVRVLERYAVGRVYEPGMRGPGPGWAAWDAALADGPPRGTLAAGARIALGEVRLTAISPQPGVTPAGPGATGREINGTSIVLMGDANGRRFLLTGDAEDDVDPGLVERGLPRLDVLKVAHHGSATATSAALLDATRPAIAVISVGADNDYGHPAPSLLERLRDVGARVWRTDRDGTVELELREDGVAVRTSGPRRSAAAAPPGRTGYDPAHDDPDPSRGRDPAALARAVREVPSPRVRGRGRRVLARPPHRGQRAPGGRAAGRDRGAAARRGQVAGRRHARPPPSRRRLGGLARRPGPPGARAAHPGSPGDQARRAVERGLAPGDAARGADRGLRRQARGPAPGADGRAVRALAPQVPARVERAGAALGRDRLDGGHVRAGRRAGARARAAGVRHRGHDTGRGPPVPLVTQGAPRDPDVSSRSARVFRESGA